jgi:hypothetical protein
MFKKLLIKLAKKAPKGISVMCNYCDRLANKLHLSLKYRLNIQVIIKALI